MEFSIDTLHVGHQDLLVQNHLVERHNKEGIQETTVEDGKTHNTTNESKVVEMLRVDARMRIDLQSVIVVCRVFKQAMIIIDLVSSGLLFFSFLTSRMD
jgi:hypothetical protein